LTYSILPEVSVTTIVHGLCSTARDNVWSCSSKCLFSVLFLRWSELFDMFEADEINRDNLPNKA